MNLIKYKESEREAYILKKGNVFWGIEHYADGYSQSSHGLVRDTADILFFDQMVKPSDSRPKVQAWIDSAEFVKVKMTKIEKVEIL